MTFTSLSLLFIAANSLGCFAAPSSDKIHNLPGFGAPPATQWSGFLNASDAPAVHGGGSMLHYWLAAYEGSEYNSWTDAPVILWLNGGPGSTSMLGFLQEMGPLLVGHNNSLFKNPYSWTKVANVVAIESPGGVGYSYCEAMKSGGSCAYDDKTTAKANAAAVRDLFSKFTELQGNPFFITGESYAGVYTPTLAKELLDGNDAGDLPKINLQGMAVGDPCTDNQSQKDSMDMLWYGHKHGFVPDSDFDLLWNHCGSRATTSMARGKGHLGDVKIYRVHSKGDSVACTAAERKFLLTTSKSFSQSWLKAFINNVSLYGPTALVRFDVPGTLDYAMAQWMLSAEVKTAIHVENSPATEWPGPATNWSYSQSYAACSSLGNRSEELWSMIDFWANISPRIPGRKVVLNGDTDPCVSYEGTRAAIKAVGFPEVSAYRPWFFNATASSQTLLNEKPLLFGPSLDVHSAGPQLGGHIVDYEHGLSFATVHGSGHMFPQFRPRSSLLLIHHVVQNTSFAPPLPSDEDLAAMSEAEWSTFLDGWVDHAQSEEYIARQ